MHPFDEMKAYIRFDDADAARLRGLWPHVRPRLHEVTDAFYDRILEFQGARDVFEGPDQVLRLKHTLHGWLEELLCGPHDRAYYDRRRRIGTMHVRVGLPHRYMFTAMQVVQEHLCRVAGDAFDGETAHEACGSLRRVAMLDLAIMTGTYLGAHTKARVEDVAAVMLAQLPSASCLVDGTGTVVGATRVARDLCGGEPVGRPLVEALPAELVRAADLPGRLAAALRDRVAVDLDRVDVVLGEVPRSFRLRVSPIEHELFAAIVFVLDITDSVAAETARRRDEALVQLGSMSAAVAHELRNPLAGISGAVQVLATSFPEGDRRRAVMGKVREQIGRLDRMVKDLLAFSRPPEARLSRVRLEDVADAVVDLARRDAPDVRVRREGRGEASADADLVHRVLLNLVQNAVGAGADEVKLVVGDGAVTVADDGPGVPADLRDRIFEPFFTTKTTGTGLGLAICRNAVQAMDGDLELLDAGPLPGAAFRLILPGAHPA